MNLSFIDAPKMGWLWIATRRLFYKSQAVDGKRNTAGEKSAHKQ